MPDSQTWETARWNMVNNQLFTNKLTDDQIAGAFLSVPREEFVPKSLRSVAYMDEGIDLGNGRMLIEPVTFARLLQAAEITSTDIILDIGCAHGYSTAILAQLAATVVGLEKDQDTIFEKFSQLENTLNKNAEGTGLGLPLARSLVEAHGGKLWLEKSSSKGSVFCFCIPNSK